MEKDIKIDAHAFRIFGPQPSNFRICLISRTYTHTSPPITRSREIGFRNAHIWRCYVIWGQPEINTYTHNNIVHIDGKDKQDSLWNATLNGTCVADRWLPTVCRIYSAGKAHILTDIILYTRIDVSTFNIKDIYKVINEHVKI